MKLGASALIAAAHDLLHRADPETPGLWPRATALLARQAMEAALDDLWSLRAPGVDLCPVHAQLLCLPYYLTGDDKLAEDVSYTWAGLSRAVHHHPYELPPTSTELLEWLNTVERLIESVKSAYAQAPLSIQER